MAGKAELDILEIVLEEEKSVPPEEPPQPPDDEGGGEDKKRRIVKITLMALALVFIAGGLSLWFYLGSERKGDGVEGKHWNEQKTALPANFVTLDRFAVNIKDGQGGLRVLVCDVVLDLNRDGGTVKDRNHDFRKTVYRVIKNKGPEMLKTPKFKNQLAKEIEKEMNGMLGAGAVKQVYFTKFTLL